MAPTELIIAAVPLALGAVAPDPQMQIFCITAFGGLMGGFVATSLRDKWAETKKQSRNADLPSTPSSKATKDQEPKTNTEGFLMRWMTHLSASVFIAPSLTYQFHPRFPEVPVESFALSVGGITGVSAVAVILIAVPAAAQWVLQKLLPTQKDLYPLDK